MAINLNGMFWAPAPLDLYVPGSPPTAKAPLHGVLLLKKRYTASGRSSAESISLLSISASGGKCRPSDRPAWHGPVCKIYR